MSAVLAELGADVIPCDLYPEFFGIEGIRCQKADLASTLPLADGSADVVLCQEGIEHLADQLHAFREFNRVLKPGGKLLITTPNISNLRAKIGLLCTGAEVFSQLPPTEADAIWFGENRSDQFYFGHVFLISLQRLRVLGSIAGFQLRCIHPTRASWGCVMLCGLFPLMALANLYAYWRCRRRFGHVDPSWAGAVYAQVAKLNLHPNVLFGKHLFVEFTKRKNLAEVGPEFHKKLAQAA